MNESSPKQCRVIRCVVVVVVIVVVVVVVNHSFVAFFLAVRPVDCLSLCG